MTGMSLEKFGSAYEYAGFWARSGAAIIDTIIIWVVAYPLFYSESFLLGGSDFVISYVMPFVATVLFWIYKSATPGKMAIKAQVLDAKTGNPPTIKQSIIRYLCYFISILPLCLGIFWVAWDSKKQGWHDKIAGTVVIRPKNRDVENVSFAGSR